MKTIKTGKNKWMALALALVMLLGLAACSGKDKGESAGTGKIENKIEEAAPSTAESVAEDTAKSKAEESAPEGIVGYYNISSMDSGGMKLDQETLESMGMADGVYLQLNADGTGELCMEIGKSLPITYDEKAGTITASQGGESMTFPFTVEGDTITITMEEAATTLCYTRSTGGAQSAGGAAVSTGDEKTVEGGSVSVGSGMLANSLTDAFTGGSGSGAGSSGGFVSPTKTLEMDTTWYGTMTTTNSQGPSAQDFTKDVIGWLSTTTNGRPFFEISTDSSMDSQYIMFASYITIDASKDGFTADIGDEDAFVINRFLTQEEWWDFSPTLNNGALEMNYHYVDPDDGSSYDLMFFLREDGTQWDEANDPLPPTYEEYKAAISK